MPVFHSIFMSAVFGPVGLLMHYITQVRLPPPLLPRWERGVGGWRYPHGPYGFLLSPCCFARSLCGGGTIKITVERTWSFLGTVGPLPSCLTMTTESCAAPRSSPR